MRKITIKNITESKDFKISMGMPGLFFGDASDGDFETTENLYYPSELDGDTIFKNYNNFTINEGHLVTTSHRCKGLVIRCQGDCTINGTLQMTARGCRGEGRLWGPPYFDQVSTIDGVMDLRIGAEGGAGGPRIVNYGNGVKGSSGINGACGGGGSGGARRYSSGDRAYSGSGATATTWSGGSGGGGCAARGGTWSCKISAESAHIDGGKGGNANACRGSGGASCAGGGAGNNGGSGKCARAYSTDGTSKPGSTGTGGVIILVVAGTLIIDGIIQSNGSNGGNASASWSVGGVGGGASGGGSITILSPNIINNGTVRANGGSRGIGSHMHGGAGGAGSIRIHKLLE